MAGFDHKGFQDRLLAAAGGAWFDFEGLIRDIYVDLLRPGDLCIDVGANRGDHLFQMAQAVAPGGKAYAIEAAPAMAAKMRAHLADNPQFSDVVELLEVAVAHVPGETSFFYSEERNGLSSLLNRGIPEAVPITVKVETLDRLLAGEGPFAFMKMDIEGAEYLAFQGAQALITTSRPLIAFEFDKLSLGYFDHTPQAMVDLARSMDYRLYDFFGHEMASGEHLEASVFWNYLAAPAGSDAPVRAAEVVRATLEVQGIEVPA